jgi:acyl transferase domain-containing protein/acyl carrier protein
MDHEEALGTREMLDDHAASEVAVIGFAGRFPGARNPEQFWQNLRDGVESISFFTNEELLESGVEPELVGTPEYIPAKAILEDVELFDAAFFDYNPREAEMLDPQHRVLLECAVEAFEHAGYDPQRFTGRIGVYAGASAGSYLHVNLSSHEELIERVGAYQVDIGNHGEFVPTTISFKLNLKGPSINIQTACSTSLVAVHVACQSLLNGECDMALSGGGSITFPHKEGYIYQEEGILSPDGHCRAFDAEARGTVGGEGAILFVLKRLVEALADGDTIHAVIKGSAVNNDGALKIGYTAPSINGQAEVISDALAIAGVGAESITYVEAHGTGTALGDPVEVAALTQAFHADTQEKSFCALGSVKSNIGHLDAAAGAAGLIKAVLALKHRQLPPSLHYERPNPKIDFESSPFFINNRLVEWTQGPTPRRAGVSSFGIGGTNAHVVVEESPLFEPSTTQTRRQQLLMLSAKTGPALDAATANLAEYLKHNRDANLADVAFTLQVGRGGYGHRRILVCEDSADALAALETQDAARLLTLFQEPRHRPVVFMFPGQGSQYVGMARGLYRDEPTFRDHLDRCAQELTAHLNLDLRDVLYPNEAGEAEAARLLDQTFITQPALFSIEYALARLWMSWGVIPSAMIGHSIGEYVAACLADVFSLEEALALVAARGQLMQSLPAGAMLAVMLSERETRDLLRPGLALAAVNGTKNCVVSGPTESIQTLHEDLERQDVHSQVLHTSHAFHSEMMEPILEAFTDRVRQVQLSAPAIRFISNVTGAFISGRQATDATYWSRHLRQTVRCGDGLGELLTDSERILLEVGPGQTLGSLVRQHPGQLGNQVVLSSLPRPRDRQADTEFLLTSVGKFWLAGGQIDWSGFYAHEQRRRIPLPTYPFERQRYYLEPGKSPAQNGRAQRLSGKKSDIADWFYLPSWRQFDLPRLQKIQEQRQPESSWLVFSDERGVGDALVERLAQRGEQVVTVRAGEQFMRTGDLAYAVNPRQKEDYDALLSALVSQGRTFAKIIHLWSVTSGDESPRGVADFEKAQESGLYSLLFLTQALASQSLTGSLQLVVVTDSVHEVNGSESLRPEHATVLGACKVIPQEHPEITCRSIDLVVPPEGAAPARLIEQLVAELTENVADRVVAYRGRHRWVQSFEAVRLEAGMGAQSRLSEGGVYLITGGLGSVGLALAQHLARTHQAKLALLSRGGLLPREEWQRWLAEHDDDDEVSDKIREIQELEAAGAEVLVLRADVSDEQQMLEAVARTVERFGRIDGVIHGAAASAIGDKDVRETTPADCRRQFQAKAQGLLVLEKVLQGRDYKFCLMLSSLSTVLGGITYTAYTAANIFMDSFVRKRNQTHAETWLSINWDAWNFDEEARPDTRLKAAANDSGIAPEAGGEALERILAMGPVTQVLVSTSDLYARLDRWVAFEDSQSAATVERAEATILHPRPNIVEVYVAPANELEQELADIWQQLLGIERVGIHDNFFELGGHSLLATMVTSRLRKEFGVELPMRRFFESPTVSGLALVIAEQVIDDQDEESIAQLLEGVEAARAAGD